MSQIFYFEFLLSSLFIKKTIGQNKMKLTKLKEMSSLPKESSVNIIWLKFVGIQNCCSKEKARKN